MDREAEKEGRRSQSHCRYCPTVNHPEERKRMCGNDAREMVFDGKRIKDRSIERSGILGCQTDPIMPPAQAWVWAICSLSSRVSVSFVVVRRQKSSNRETFLNKTSAGDAFILPVAPERGQHRRSRRRRNLAPFAVSGALAKISRDPPRYLGLLASNFTFLSQFRMIRYHEIRHNLSSVTILVI